jgi:hypothetical protein
MKRAFQATTLLLAIVAVATITACASGGGGRGARCTPLPRDTIYRVSGVVYRDCAVDRAARPLASNPHPSFTPNTNGGPTCYAAEFEFVVDERGRPETQTVQAIRSTDQSFSASVAQNISALLYEPAMKGGEPVKQIFDYKESMSVVKMLVPAGAPIRPPAARPPAC